VVLVGGKFVAALAADRLPPSVEQTGEVIIQAVERCDVRLPLGGTVTPSLYLRTLGLRVESQAKTLAVQYHWGLDACTGNRQSV
jgi:hypothetical protein